MFRFKDQSECTMCLFFITGLLIVLFIAFAVSGGFDLPKGCCDSGGWIYEYQTLIAGLAAAFIGLMAASYTRHQYKDTIFRRRLSEKAKMSDAISSLCGFAAGTFFAAYENEIESNLNLHYPKDDVNTLKSVIEFLDSNTAESVFELVVFCQVFDSRIKTTENEIPYISRRSDILYDSVKLHAVSSRLFAYARREVDSLSFKKPSKEEMHQSLNNIVFNRHDMYEILEDADVKKIIERF